MMKERRKILNGIIMGFLISTAWFLAACGPTDSKAQSCADLGSGLGADSGTTHPAFRVIRPNGGEVYHVGDTLHVRVTGNLNQSNALIKLFVGTVGNVRNDVVPGQTTSRNVFQDCDIAFAIPATLGAGAIPMVSDSVKIRVEEYNQGVFFYDFSDAYFQIKP